MFHSNIEDNKPIIYPTGCHENRHDSSTLMVINIELMQILLYFTQSIISF